MNFSKLRDTEKSIDSLLDNDKMNLSFTSGVDSDVDTDDETINNDLLSPLY